MLKNLNDRMLKLYVEKSGDLKESLNRVLGNERGAGAVEYGLIIAVVVLMVVGAAKVMDVPLQKFFEKAVKKVTDFIP